MKSYRYVLIALTFAIALLMAGWLSKRLESSSLSCPFCWREGTRLAWRWINEKLLLRPQDIICRATCDSNLFFTAIAILKHYVPEHDGFLPDQKGWERWVINYCKTSLAVHCPNTNLYGRSSYCLNPKLSGKSLKEIREPEKTILIFECDEKGQPIARHHFGELFKHCCHVAFADGRIGHLTAAQVERLLQRQPFSR
ncbi:hypothetical protein B0813_002312 [Candidatus Fervidibacteria bacterium JGI MDM2 SSWTFF-3-K9]